MKENLPNVQIGALFGVKGDNIKPIYPWLDNSPVYQECNMNDIAKIVNSVDYLVLPASQITQQLTHDIEFNYPDIHIIIWVSSHDESFILATLKKDIPNSIIKAIIVNNPNQSSKIYDIAIIGGGINGCGIARDASGRGLSVYLCDKDGIGNETSSSSTKLIHGGLRYLENYDFKMVQKALQEREKLAKIAPHIISESTFIFPHQKHLRPKWMIQIGVWLYDFLASSSTFAKSKAISLKNTQFGEPLIDNITHGFSYSDCRTSDHRLVILNALDAQNNGATIEPYNKCNKVKVENGIWNISTENGEIKAKTLINATGPWADTFADMQNINYDERSLKHVKGSHIVVPKLFGHEGCYIFQDGNKRIVFALPYEKDFTLIGTTEETVKTADNPTCSENEQEYLCKVINGYFKQNIAPNDIVWSYAGVRPLIDAKSTNNRTASRDYTLDIAEKDNAPYLNIWGGKLTTYRTLAEKALEMLAPYNSQLENNIGWTAKNPLLGGETPPQEVQKQLVNEFPFLDRSIIERYSHTYGTLYKKILTNVNKEEDLGINFSHGLYQVEVDYLIKYEWAKTTNDILWKKTKLGLTFADMGVKALEKYLAK
jgi:glycerol-3-phosphate dehydrogenase